VHGGVVCIFETHRKEEEVIGGERGFDLPGLHQTIVHLVSQSALQMWTHPSDTIRFLNHDGGEERRLTVAETDMYVVHPRLQRTFVDKLAQRFDKSLLALQTNVAQRRIEV